jgi:probable F420-dependent oxidoreductase
MKIGKIGAWVNTNALNSQQLVELVSRLEKLSYGALWYPESTAYDSLVLGGFLLSKSENLVVASGIANIYARDSFTAKAGHNSLNSLYNGRFIMGLGVSHDVLVNGRRGHVYGKPLETMRSYLEGMHSADVDIAVPESQVVLAALGPKMLELSKKMANGALPYCVTPEHTSIAKSILGPDKALCVEQKICLTANPDIARSIASKNMARYVALNNYRSNWLRLGFSDNELEGGGNQRFLDKMVLWGSEESIRQGLQDHFDAGATHVAIQSLDPAGGTGPDWKALEAFSPDSWGNSI